MYNLNKLKVLVADDNKPMRLLIRSLLMDLGVGEVIATSTGEDTWQSFIFSKPDIILLDWNLGDIDGVKLTQKIRQSGNEYNNAIPIVMSTGFTTRENVEAARDAGVTEFLVKPFTVKGLARHMEHIIEKPRKFITSKNYIGPDRRRKRVDVNATNMKRSDDPPPPSKKKKKDDKDGIYDLI